MATAELGGLTATFIIKTHRMLLISLLVLVLGIFLVSTLACEPAMPIRVKNQTDKTLTIFIIGVRIGDVKPGEEIKNDNPVVAGVYKDYLIEAKDVNGNIIYSKEFSYDELFRDMNYEVVIPPTSE